MSSSSGSDGEAVVPVKRVKRHHHPVTKSDVVKLQKVNLYSHKILPKLDALAKSPIKLEDNDNDEGNESVPFDLDITRVKNSPKSPVVQTVKKRTAASPNSSQEIVDSDCSPVKVVPPTPPPPFQPQKRSRRRKKASKILEEVTSVLSQVSKAEAGHDAIQSPQEEVNLEREIMVKVRFRGKLNKFPLVESESFSSIFEKMSKRAKVDAAHLLITHGDRRVFPSDTPADIRLCIADILECVVAHQRLPPDVKDMIQIQLQGPFLKKKVLYTMGKTEPFLGIMEEFARKIKATLTELEFKFDGESVSVTSTPKALDMDTDDCIDVMRLTEP